MRRNNFVRDLLLLLLVIYYSQGSLYVQGSFLSQGILLFILTISGYFFLKTLVLKSNKNNFYKTWSALLILNIFGFVFTADYYNPLHLGMLKLILINFLPFYPFYYFSNKGYLKARHLLRFFLLLLPITILQFSLHANQILADRITDNTDIVNNIAYSFVALIPFVFLLKKNKFFSILAMGILIFFLIQGSKRGALISGAIGLLLFIYFHLRTIEQKNRLKGYLIGLLVTSCLSYYAYNVYEQNEYLISRMQNLFQEGGSSSRDIIYTNIFNGWYSSESYFNLLFGFGFAASLKLSGTNHFAHNDWLELLSNFGLLALLIYFFLFYSIIKEIYNPELDVDKKILLVTIILLWLISSLVSMFYTSPNGFIYSLLLAFLIGSKERKLE